MKQLVGALAFLALLLAACSPQRPPAAPLATSAPVKPLPPSPTLSDSPSSFMGPIVIDPGHGGHDEGTVNKAMGLVEKKLNFKTSQLVFQQLKKQGIAALLTRTKDIFIDLDERASFANRARARLFVSVHHNSAPNKKAEGVEIYYCEDPSNRWRSAQSKHLAQLILRRMPKQTPLRGVRPASFRVIRCTKMPAVLVECGFVTNLQEARRLRNPQYTEQVAQAISAGIRDYLRSCDVLTQARKKRRSYAYPKPQLNF
jgi:N-acetylmuramoyl-L-alanine amidase